MQTLELFSGTKSFSKVMSKHGYDILTVDNNKELSPDVCIDINDFSYDGDVDVLWASPPCTTFSVASIPHYWYKGKPKNQKSLDAIKLLDKTISLIKEINPKIWFIENPRGMMRTVIDEIFSKYGITNYKRNTVSYCQYGAKIMKPTDIWTNLLEWNGKLCKNGSPCHEAAPRGINTGLQGIQKKGKNPDAVRGVIPPKLFEEILSNMSIVGI